MKQPVQDKEILKSTPCQYVMDQCDNIRFIVLYIL